MIRRVALLVTGTVATVAAVLSYNPPNLTAPVASGGVSTGTKAPSQSPNTTNSPSSNSQSSNPTAAPTKSAGNNPTQTPNANPAAGVFGTFAGQTSQTRWGPVAVQIKVVDGVITSAQALQFPNGDRRSLSISQQAIPFLIEETLSVQTGKISGVTGASYTSGGWILSLNSAIKKAGI